MSDPEAKVEGVGKDCVDLVDTGVTLDVVDDVDDNLHVVGEVSCCTNVSVHEALSPVVLRRDRVALDRAFHLRVVVNRLLLGFRASVIEVLAKLCDGRDYLPFGSRRLTMF